MRYDRYEPIVVTLNRYSDLKIGIIKPILEVERVKHRISEIC